MHDPTNSPVEELKEESFSTRHRNQVEEQN